MDNWDMDMRVVRPGGGAAGGGSNTSDLKVVSAADSITSTTMDGITISDGNFVLHLTNGVFQYSGGVFVPSSNPILVYVLAGDSYANTLFGSDGDGGPYVGVVGFYG